MKLHVTNSASLRVQPRRGLPTFTFLQPRRGLFTRSFVQPAGAFVQRVALSYTQFRFLQPEGLSYTNFLQPEGLSYTQFFTARSAYKHAVYSAQWAMSFLWNKLSQCIFCSSAYTLSRAACRLSPVQIHISTRPPLVSSCPSATRVPM